jgi:DNA-binding NarL/FixJ family response regulator
MSTEEMKEAVARLSPKDIKMFRLLGEGNTASQVALQMEVTTSTIRKEIDRAKSRSGVKTTIELIVAVAKLDAIGWSV